MTIDLDLDQLAALAAAVSEGTFEAAARTLHVTPSAISQRIKALETTVGRVLLTRAKPVRPTESGETLLRAARQIEAVIADAAQELGDEQSNDPRGDSARRQRRQPGNVAGVVALAEVGSSLVFDLRRDDQMRTAEMLRDGTVVGAVTALRRPVPGCIVEPLGQMRYRAGASREFVAKWFADGATVPELARAPLVCFDREDQLQDTYLRRRTRRSLDPPRHYVPGSSAFVGPCGTAWAGEWSPTFRRSPTALRRR